jgi:hypothetical protein
MHYIGPTIIMPCDRALLEQPSRACTHTATGTAGRASVSPPARRVGLFSRAPGAATGYQMASERVLPLGDEIERPPSDDDPGSLKGMTAGLQYAPAVSRSPVRPPRRVRAAGAGAGAGAGGGGLGLGLGVGVGVGEGEGVGVSEGTEGTEGESGSSPGPVVPVRMVPLPLPRSSSAPAPVEVEVEPPANPTSNSSKGQGATPMSPHTARPPNASKPLTMDEKASQSIALWRREGLTWAPSLPLAPQIQEEECCLVAAWLGPRRSRPVIVLLYTPSLIVPLVGGTSALSRRAPSA